MKKFYLKRIEDESGVSGTGIVAQGIIFDNGKCAMSWNTTTSSIAIYNSIQDVKTIHGHCGKTKVLVQEDYTGDPDLEWWDNNESYKEL